MCVCVLYIVNFRAFSCYDTACLAFVTYRVAYCDRILQSGSTSCWGLFLHFLLSLYPWYLLERWISVSFFLLPMLCWWINNTITRPVKISSCYLFKSAATWVFQPIFLIKLLHLYRFVTFSRIKLYLIRSLWICA